MGTHVRFTATVYGQTLKARMSPEVQLPAGGASVWLQVLGEHTCFYQNEEIVA